MPAIPWARRHHWAGRRPHTARGQINFTEQGEMLFYRCNNMETAIYELTMGVTDLLKARVSLVKPVAKDIPEYFTMMNELSRIGENGFLELTEHTEGFRVISTKPRW